MLPERILYCGAELIKHVAPRNHSRQVSSKYFIEMVFKSIPIKNILDLGCGKGDSVDYFVKANSNIKWVGIDIEKSPEVSERGRKDINFITYDGLRIPCKDNYFDLVYCNQVYEHIQQPFELIIEIDRIIRPGGFFVGSTSYLEPFHSQSICNFTPYGFTLLLRDTNLKLLEIRPGIDVVSILMHRLFGRVPVIKNYFASCFTERESIVNLAIGKLCKIIGKSDQDINLIKLLFCGQFSFLAQKESFQP
ncbi:MAG: hypothetical protein HW406_60 [Candidatus Brocadiaceae bacterium]|nr:hypothetical protein [Candidatus Brocadiaceae bacterium]